jgi:NADH:ubiquinone oxidoreductase subunit
MLYLQYYERLTDTQFGRHRWVEYKDNDMYNASTVPPEWHGWLHYITDYTPSEMEAFTVSKHDDILGNPKLSI